MGLYKKYWKVFNTKDWGDNYSCITWLWVECFRYGNTGFNETSSDLNSGMTYIETISTSRYLTDYSYLSLTLKTPTNLKIWAFVLDSIEIIYFLEAIWNKE